MSNRIRALRGSVAAREANRRARRRDYLDWLDQASFQSLRATGQAQLMQGVWIYEHPLDVEGLKRFHADFGYGLGGRLIERSPLPFGRHHWVSALGPASDLTFCEPRPRSELSDWLDERAQLPIDPEFGPRWRLDVLPMTDGSTAVTLFGSHCLADGLGAGLTIMEAVYASRRDLGYELPHSRTRIRGMLTDLAQVARDTPLYVRTLAGAARLLYRSRHELTGKPAARPATAPTGNPDEVVVIPTIAIFVDRAEWDARAEQLGGTGYSLLAGFAANLGDRMGRRHTADKDVTLLVALSDRSLEDTRAHAMSFVNIAVDPTGVTTDLSDTRARIRAGLHKLRENGEEGFDLLPLAPFVPKRALRWAADLVFNFDDLPVSCSNLGDVDGAFARLDGTEAEYVMLRAVDQNVRRGELERAGGQLVVVGGAVGDKISIGVSAYQVGAQNSKSELRELAKRVLGEFDLAGVIL